MVRRMLHDFFNYRSFPHRENRHNLIVEGCYIPFDWKSDFEKTYLQEIKYYCLILSENYIKQHFEDIKNHACDIEKRLDDTWCTKELVLSENTYYLQMCRKYQCSYILIDKEYKTEIEEKINENQKDEAENE